MKTPPFAPPPVRRWLFSILALVATVAQLTVALSPLVERERSMASHVESGSAAGHYAHNDATCPSCQARSIHGTAPRPEVPRVAVRLAPETPTGRIVAVVA